MSTARQIAEWTHGLTFAALPPEAVAVAKRAILDTLGCAIAGSDEACVGAVRRLYEGPMGAGAPLLTGSGWAPVELAALINGTAAHALDYDDVCLTVTTHPSAAVVPAVLAVGYARRRSGADAVTAYLIGLEVSTRVGEVMGFTHYKLGWHATMTLGVMGAAAAAGYLLGLNPERLTMALGLAGSLAGGLRIQFGTMTKPLHAGLAAQHGVRAALLAEQGFTADADVFGAGGYFAAFSGGAAAAPAGLPLGEPFDLLASGLAVKKFPCCYATHRLIDGALTLAHRHDLRSWEVEQVEIVAPPGALAPLNRPRPQTGLEGKFSAEYTAAAAILDRQVNLATFTDERVQRPVAQDLLRRVAARETAPPGAAVKGIEEGEVRVAVTLRSGERVNTIVAFPPGSPQRPLSDAERWEKFSDCLAGAPAARAEALFTAGLNLEACADLQEFWQRIKAATAGVRR